MRYRVKLLAEVLVDVEQGGAESALRLARDHVANDWLLRRREGTRQDALHYVIKGLSADVTGAVPFEGNPEVEVMSEEEGGEE